MPDVHDWWSQLRHGGMLVAPALLPEFFPDVGAIPTRQYERLRSEWIRFGATPATSETRRAFVDGVLEGFLNLSLGWQKGNQVEARFKAVSPGGDALRPQRVLLKGDVARLAVVVDDVDRIGVGRGRRAHARLVDLLRSTGMPLGLLTNGVQFRVLHAGPDYDAWAEWDASAWFDVAEGRAQLAGLRTTLGAESLLAKEISQLSSAVQASRVRQGDLAQVLGEQVRKAVELLLGSLDHELRRDPDLLSRIAKDPQTGHRLDDQSVLRALYQAGTRLVMRLVVLLFAEARDLLPASVEIYHQSYGVDGLYQQLSDAARADGAAGLGDRRSSWPRLLALFRIVWGGSPHQELPIPAYGGSLFMPGDADDADAVLRALAAFEDVSVDDAIIWKVLRLLKVGRVRVRRGTQSAWVAGPVDFSDLRTEYIGIIYEGLLDYGLRRAAEDDAVVFLNLGRQPALPLQRLESLSDADIKRMIEALRKDRGTEAVGEDGEGDEREDEEEAGPEAEDGANTAAEEPGQDLDDSVAEGLIEGDSLSDEDLFRRAQSWAERAVEVGGLVRRPRGRGADGVAYARQRVAAAQQLIAYVVPAGGLYLAAWGGLRKGSGTFYTRPALAVPLAQRTLEPLCYEAGDGRRIPRQPEEILGIKVCDPAMGSGSFLVSALRYLTEALAASLATHKRITARGEQAVVSLPFGSAATGAAHEELLPVPPDDERFDSLLRARLARHVVERCIYGVDINPMAVELARLALWVETLDRELPFEFLDHKLKVGNSLVGCWLQLVEDYPARGWEREAGDGRTGSGSKWLKDLFTGRVKPELAAWIRAAGGQGQLFGETGIGPVQAAGRLRERFASIHELPAELREAAYRELIESDDYADLKKAMDRWCAVWFWPALQEPAMTPSVWRSPTAAADEVVDQVYGDRGFFHWEIEFPDVFRPDRRGFDAVLGNPPWEISKPNSQEFFSNEDPLYRTYGKQEALSVQRSLFESDASIEDRWVRYQGGFKAMSNWVAAASEPFAVAPGRGKEGEQLAEAWALQRRGRSGTAEPDQPFRHQGSADLNTYKLFLEAAHHLLAPGGRLGFVVPSGIWTDKGSTDLRRLFIERCQWEWCYGFENRLALFPIHRSFKYAPIIVERGGRTTAIRSAFMRLDMAEWERPDPPVMDLRVTDVRRFAPTTLSFMELKERADLTLAEKVYGEHPLLGDLVIQLGGSYSREFDMTNDSKLFTTRRELEKRKILAAEEDTRDPRIRARLWVSGLVCLYEGKGFWLNNPYYGPLTSLIPTDVLDERVGRDTWSTARVCTRNVASSTNQRTLVTGLLPPAGHGNSSPTLDGLSLDSAIELKAVMSSLVLDYILRMKVSTNLNWFYLETLPIARADGRSSFARRAPDLVWRLNAIGADFDEPAKDPIVDPAERLAARLLLDALVAEVYELTPKDMAHIATRFPIYDKGVPEEHRYPNLAVQVFRVMHAEGAEQAEREAYRLAEIRRAQGFGFGLDEIYVPEGGWEKANRDARRILREG